MQGARKIAHALDGLIRSRTKGHGGEDYARKCVGEIAEGIEEITAKAPLRAPNSPPTAQDVVAVRHLLIREAQAQMQVGGSNASTIAVQHAAGAVLLGAHLGDLCASLRLTEEPVRDQVAILTRGAA